MMELRDSFSPDARFGVCSVCGTQQRPNVKVFRTQAYIEYEGQIEICARCIQNAAEQLNMVSAELHNRTKETNARQVAKMTALESEAQIAQDALNAANEAHRLQIEQKDHEIEQTRVKSLQEGEQRGRTAVYAEKVDAKAKKTAKKSAIKSITPHNPATGQ